MEYPSYIKLSGAKQNNLKNLTVKIPLYSFSVLCGPSGSGKSSLAFETLFAEGQRRYVESLSNYSKQFVQKLPAPLIDKVENIPPSIFIGQKNKIKSSHSTVGKATETLEGLTNLFSKIGKAFCPDHKIPLEVHSIYKGTQKIINTLNQKKIYILSPIDLNKRKHKGKTLTNLLLKDGYFRIFILNQNTSSSHLNTQPLSGKILSLNEKNIDKHLKQKFYLLIDRIKVDQKDKNRIQDSLSQAFNASLNYNHLTVKEALVLSTEGEKLFLSEDNSCPYCTFRFPAFDSRMFDFNNPIGACSSCKGFGNTLIIDLNKVIPRPQLSLAEGAIKPFTYPSAKGKRRKLTQFCKEKKIDLHTPWENMSPSHQKLVWKNIQSFFDYLERKKYKMHVRVLLSRFRSQVLCKDCKGKRLKKKAFQVYLGKKSIDEYLNMPISSLFKVLSELKICTQEKKTYESILSQIIPRLQFLIHMGIGYLTLNRPTNTLSGGEFQRLNLSHQLGKNLSQILYILDEPTIGLHPRDTQKLIQTLKILKERKNTLLVVEHDADVIQKASHIIEMGPQSGENGGEIIFEGSIEDFLKNKNSNTASYIDLTQRKKHLKSKTPNHLMKDSILLKKKCSPKVFSQTKKNLFIPHFKTRPVDIKKHKYKIEITCCTKNNLKKVNLSIPLHRFVSVTGVSGSGKSSLISETLYPALIYKLKKQIPPLEGKDYKKIKNVEYIKNVFLIDQSPIGKTIRSSLLSTLNIYSPIRDLLASTKESKDLKYTSGHFSFNISKGRCPDCEGIGFNTISMIFMDDIQTLCEKCHGKKFKDSILEITYKGKNISDILNMTVNEALKFFSSYSHIRKPLLLLKEVGLDYLKLGQNTQTLSGGENQRLKIAKHLSSSLKKGILYIMDEPTKGLHFQEVHKLLKVLHQLIDSGNSVLVIEHNLEVLRNSDYIIDIGPETEANGGRIVAKGAPNEIVKKSKGSLTAFYLKEYLRFFPFFH